MALNEVKIGIRSIALFFIFELCIIAFYLMAIGAFTASGTPDPVFTKFAASINNMTAGELAALIVYIFTFLNFFFCFAINFLRGLLK